MEHAAAMRSLQRTGDSDGDLQHVRDGNPLSPVALAQDGGTQLHDQIGPAVSGNARAVHRHDRGVGTQLGHQVGLGTEHLPDLVIDHLSKHDLDGHLPPRHVLLVEEHIGEASGAEHADEGEAG